MNGAMRTASFTVHRNSFFRVGVVEPDKYDIPAVAPRYCPCGRRWAKGNKGELCRRHEEIERRLRVKAMDKRLCARNTTLCAHADFKPKNRASEIDKGMARFYGTTESSMMEAAIVGGWFLTGILGAWLMNKLLPIAAPMPIGVVIFGPIALVASIICAFEVAIESSKDSQ